MRHNRRRDKEIRKAHSESEERNNGSQNVREYARREKEYECKGITISRNKQQKRESENDKNRKEIYVSQIHTPNHPLEN